MNPFTSSIISEQAGHAQIRSETIRLLQNAAFLMSLFHFSLWGKNYNRNRLKLLMSLPHEGMEVAEIFGVAAADLIVTFLG